MKPFTGRRAGSVPRTVAAKPRSGRAGATPPLPAAKPPSRRAGSTPPVPLGKPLVGWRAGSRDQGRGRKKPSPKIDPHLLQKVKAFLEAVAEWKVKDGAMVQGMRSHKRELVISVFGYSRQLQADLQLFAVYRLTALKMGGSRPPKDANDVYRVLLKDAYETPEMASWAWKKTEAFWEDSTSTAETIAPWIRKHGVKRAAIAAGLEDDPKAVRQPVGSGNPPKRRAPAEVPAAGKPPMGNSMPHPEAPPALPPPAAKPMRTVVRADVVRVENAEGQGANTWEVQQARFILPSEVDVRVGNNFAFQAANIEYRGDKQVITGPWRLLE